MKTVPVILCIALAGTTTWVEADPTPTPLKTIEMGNVLYRQASLSDYMALLTDIQTQLDPKLVPGWYDPSPIDRIRMQVVSPIDPNLFKPQLKFPGDLSIPDPRTPCELFADTWEDSDAVDCACEVFSEFSNHNYYQALAQATFAGNRVASGGQCWPPMYER